MTSGTKQDKAPAGAAQNAKSHGIQGQDRKGQVALGAGPVDPLGAANWLGTLAILIQDRVEARWQAELDLSPMSAAALVQVEQEAGCAIDLVATRIGLSHSATVRLIDKLVERDLVAKDRARDDQRAQSLKLTKSGRKLAAQLHQIRNRVTDDLLGLVSPAEGQALGKAVATILHRAVTTKREGDMVCRVCDEGRCRPEICPIQEH